MTTKTQKMDKRLAFVAAVCNWGSGDLKLANEWYQACNGVGTPNDVLIEKYKKWLGAVSVPANSTFPALLMDVSGRMYRVIPPAVGDADGWVRMYGSSLESKEKS